MELDSNYIAYLVEKQVASAVKEALKPIYERNGLLTERYYQLKSRLYEIAQTFDKSRWEAEDKGKSGKEAEAEIFSEMNKAAKELGFI